MAVVRPPVTGDPIMDSWTNQVTKSLAGVNPSAAVSGTGTGTGTGTPGPAGAPGMNGFNAATVILYQSVPTNVDPAGPTGDVVYEYASAGITSGSNNLNGWALEFPDDTDPDTADYVFRIHVFIADTAATETIASTSWSSPILEIAREPPEEGIDIRVTATAGTFFRSDQADTKTLTALVSVGGVEQSAGAHATYHYDWRYMGNLVYVVEDPMDPSMRRVQATNGVPIVEGDTPPANGILAGTSMLNANNTFQTIQVAEADVANGMTLHLTVDVSNIP